MLIVKIFLMKEKTNNLKTIAAALNLSVNTVSRALRDCDDISEATKKNVRNKAYELGYLPNNVFQFVNSDDKQLVAIVIKNLTNTYFVYICQKIVSLFNSRNVHFTIVFGDKDYCDKDVIKQCIYQRTDIIISLLEILPEAIEISKLQNIKLISVGLENNDDYVDQVFFNSEDGCMIVANYLMNYHRLHKLVYVGISSMHTSNMKYNYFFNFAQKIDENVEIEFVERDEISSKLPNLITQGYLGIFCFNDELAYLVLKKLNNIIPNVRKVFPRLHIVGYDCLNTRVDGLIDITSIDTDFDKMCEIVCDIVQARLNGECDKPLKKILPVSLHQRKYN